MRHIDVFGPIGRCYDESGKSAAQFAAELREAGGDDVTVHINSGGGDVFDAHAMAESLRAYRGRTTASIEGLAASSASFFALTADEVVINPSALVMIHNPTSGAYGTADDMRKTAEMLDKTRSTISGSYAGKTGRDVEEIERLMDAETWFDAAEAVEFGLADRMTEDEPVAACIDPAMLEGYRNAPESLSATNGAAETPSGDDGANMPDSTDEPEAGAARAHAGVAERVVCVNGAFLKVRGNRL